METTELVCKRCKGRLQHDVISNRYYCPYCKTYVLINETERVTLQKIQAKNAKDIELGKKQIEKEAELGKSENDKQIRLSNDRVRIKKIRLAVFIILLVALIPLGVLFGYWYAHKNEIKMPLPASEYCNRNYQDTYNLLADAGFENINYVVSKNLLKSEQSEEGIVTQISINGNTSFSEGTWFDKQSQVKIAYSVIDPNREGDISMPISSVDCIGLHSEKLVEVFNEAGFKNISDVVIADLNKEHQDHIGVVTKISINNKTDFYRGDFFPQNAVIEITYHVMDPDRVSDILIPDDFAKFLLLNYAEVRDAFKSAGFINVVLIPQYDLGLFEGSKDGIVQIVSVNGNDAFEGNRWVPANSTVRIMYRSKAIEYKEKQYTEIETLLKDIGFSSIECIALDDLSRKEEKKRGVVESVQVNGQELSNLDEINLSSAAVIKYHSMKKAGANEVYITTAAKDLSGKDFKEVIRILTEMGFTNISNVALEDLSAGWFSQENTVKEVSIDGNTKFEIGDIFNKTVKVTVSYHSFKPKPTNTPPPRMPVNGVAITLSSKELCSMAYSEAVGKLKEMGFTNIRTEALGDIGWGWFYKENEVKEIEINGSTKFSVGDVYARDAEIVVKYHSKKQ